MKQAVAFMSFHRSACYSACLSLCFYAWENVAKGWETGLDAWRLSTSLAPLNFSSNTLAHVVPFRVSSRTRCLRFCVVLISLDLGFGGHMYTTFLRGGRGRLFGCTRWLPERGGASRDGPVNADFDSTRVAEAGTFRNHFVHSVISRR